MMSVQVFLKSIFLISIFASVFGKDTNKPNIILLLSDDLGWNDVGFHGSNEIPTPNIDALAYHGAILKRHYTQPICTPSRAALMTGKYPIRIGFQGGPLRNPYPVSLPLNETLLPQYLKKLGYATSLLGKWHLGFYRKACTPNERGFDSFFGYYSGVVRYNDSKTPMPDTSAYDARDNFRPAADRFIGKYSTDVYADEAVRIIRQHNKSKPLFMEVSFTAVHSLYGNILQVRNFTENEATFSYIKNKNRRLFAGVLTAMDESIGKIIRALDEESLIKNSIIIFSSDNGGETDNPLFQNYGSNWPLRGKKGTVLEGGVRVPAAIWSPFTQQNAVLNDYIHLTDWIPTLYAAAGGNPPSGIDGVNQWKYLQGLSPKGSRSQILVNIDEKTKNAALIKDTWKLVRIINNTLKYYPFEGLKWSPKYKMDAVISSPTHIALSKYNKRQLTETDFLEARKKADIREQCKLRLNQSDEEVNKAKLSCFETGCLFDLENDPCEFKDLSKRHSEKVTELGNILKTFEGQLVKQWSAERDPKSSPKNFNNYWTSWVA